MQFYAFGREVPAGFIDALIADGTPAEAITTDYLETLLWYDFQDEN